VAEQKEIKLLARLSQSRIYQDYERAFSEATGLPLTLRSIEAWQPVHRGKGHENPFCALLMRNGRACGTCLSVQESLAKGSSQAAQTVVCFAGLRDSTVPIRLGNRLVGFLQTGQVRMTPPTQQAFKPVARQLLAWGMKGDLSALEEAYLKSVVLSPRQYRAVLRLLGIFGQHLSLLGNYLVVQQNQAEPPAVTRARRFIHDHQARRITLNEVASAVNISTYYFCKMFKRATGFHFTEYLSRVRVERAKNLLLNPNARVSEIAYDAGFQSLTHFNRVFKKVTGFSPTAYRNSLP